MFDSQPFIDDLTAVLDDWDTATYTPTPDAHPSGSTITIQGIFRSDYIDILGVITNKPNFLVRTGIVLTPANGDRMTLTNVVLDQTFNSRDFTVREYQKSGDDTTLLILEKL